MHNAAFCSELSDDEREKLNSIAHLRRFPKGATILAEGEEAGIVGNVIEGVLKMQKTQPDGRQQIVGLLVPTDMFGRVFTGTSDFAIEAATDVTLCCFDKRRFEALVLEHPRLEHQVMLSILDELDAARDWITLLGAQTVAQKLAGFLLMLCRRWPAIGCGLSPDRRHVEIHVPISRADLAQYLGTTVETISRTVQALARSGLIEVVTPTQFIVIDLKGLIAASGNEDFDPATILQCVKSAS
ncbi:MAG: Crp/Fnr family transcriptional regulator [Paracoccaceae bacterium]|nr:Crp/Fnr family transcriptional regulator [Paracoccaceae bacterium]